MAQTPRPTSVPEYKIPVRVATVAAGVMTTAYENGDTIDGVVLATGNRLLIKNGAETNIGTYTYDSTAGIPNLAGEAEPNNASESAITSINFFDSNAAAADQSAVFAELRERDEIIIAPGLENMTFVLTGPAVDNGTYWTVPCVLSPSTELNQPFTKSTEVVQNVFNGIYTVNATGAPTRAADFIAGSAEASAHITVQEGTENGSRLFLCTNIVGADIVDTDSIYFTIDIQPSYANGIGGFRPSAEGPTSNADNGHFNPGSALATSAIAGIRFSGKTYDNRGWGWNQASPIKVQAMISQGGGPGAHLILRNREDAKEVSVYRVDAAPIVVSDAGLNDDTQFNDLTHLGATMTKFTVGNVYELSIVPQGPSAGFSGSGTIAPGGALDFFEHWCWPNFTSWTNWAWDDLQFADTAANNPATELNYDNTGILMPADGVITSFSTSINVMNGTDLGIKPTLTLISPDEDAATETNTSMTNTSLTFRTCVSGETQTTHATVEGLTYQNLANTVFKRGDKLVITLMEGTMTGAVTLVRFNWSIRVVYFDATPTGEAPGDS